MRSMNLGSNGSSVYNECRNFVNDVVSNVFALVHARRSALKDDDPLTARAREELDKLLSTLSDVLAGKDTLKDILDRETTLFTLVDEDSEDTGEDTSKDSDATDYSISLSAEQKESLRRFLNQGVPVGDKTLDHSSVGTAHASQRSSSALSLSTRLFESRIATGMSRKEVADKIGWTPTTISNWEKGKSRPNLTVRKQLAELYGVSYEYLAV